MVAIALVAAGAGCSGGGGDESNGGRSTAAPVRSRPRGALPPPVAIRAEPEGVTLEDPRFDPLPGAKADFGRLGGAVYQIEMPERWSGRLVLEMHGFGEFAPETNATPPDFRRYLIAQGIAWGASSFSSSALIPGRAADETAALWDHFARKYGRPKWTYVTGWSMGGAATNIAAERYADRFDGALAFCGAASQTPALGISADFIAAAAYVAGVRQAEYDASTDLAALIRDRIRPALHDPAKHRQFEDILIDLTGGPRAFDREGILAEEETNWRRGTLLVTSLIAANRDTKYRLGPRSPVTSDVFDRDVIRFRVNEPLRRILLEGNETAGRVAMPLLSMHTTGDGQVPIGQARLYRQRVEAAGRGARLVERIVEDPGHCGFTTEEQEAGFDALVAWVERGVRPRGTDVRISDLRNLRPVFNRLPRIGTPAGDSVTGARDRAVLRGHLRVDGAAVDAQFLGAVVLRDGLSAPCQLELPPVVNGAYEITVAADAEIRGCGGPRARVALWTYVRGQQLFSGETVPWPGNGMRAGFDATFSSAMPHGVVPQMTDFSGGVYHANGRHLPPGTRVDAFVERTLCGVGSVRRTGSFLGYILHVAGPESVPGCAWDARIDFRIDGRPAAESGINGTSPSGGLTDLTVR
jgi:pimeloyl-ACP methyl ester carboxylesterase